MPSPCRAIMPANTFLKAKDPLTRDRKISFDRTKSGIHNHHASGPAIADRDFSSRPPLPTSDFRTSGLPTSTSDFRLPDFGLRTSDLKTTWTVFYIFYSFGVFFRGLFVKISKKEPSWQKNLFIFWFLFRKTRKKLLITVVGIPHSACHLCLSRLFQKMKSSRLKKINN